MGHKLRTRPPATCFIIRQLGLESLPCLERQVTIGGYTCASSGLAGAGGRGTHRVVGLAELHGTRES